LVASDADVAGGTAAEEDAVVVLVPDSGDDGDDGAKQPLVEASRNRAAAAPRSRASRAAGRAGAPV
jgi:hypothetical protein